ncbi:hypothetical protein X805_04660 [Sphaerotilus natans subsp. natans DSM 6575]|uniref:Uncharacterized protein n=1 Tax=Sphaerotilus natans subsp. natans DSM 6575 TaxID=1286631 RepID=A0A059KR00_9BURK|nr:hypothetical protein [Sphaerotilus natans]KDB53912.1 hypothetical protein X805_04660 [Sphaerotilus natans subsp. natans DSM 6575]SIR68503.1 hypothetical protein SAMN05421778_11489 [Sphaerotilus natans]
MRHPALLTAAVCTSSIGIGMSVASALDRAVTPADQVLFGAIGVAVTAGAHVLPALTRTAVGRALWGACLAVTVYGHAGYFASAIDRAGEHRAEHVAEVATVTALRDQLQSITARPTATVAAALGAAQRTEAAARTAAITCAKPCSTLQGRATAARARVTELETELAEARRADALREQLTQQASQSDARRDAARIDPAAAAISRLTGADASTVQTSVQLLSACLVELLAALLWSLALRPAITGEVSVVARTNLQTAAVRRKHFSPFIELRAAWSSWRGALGRTAKARDRPAGIEPSAPWPRHATP